MMKYVLKYSFKGIIKQFSAIAIIIILGECMIKNVIFDFGQVLVRFEPKYMVEQYVSDLFDSALLQTVIFDRLYWDKLDAGTITDAETVACIKERIPPRLHGVAEKIYYNWIYNIPEIDGMDALVTRVKQALDGKIFLLSNISTYFAEHKQEIPILRHFENCVFSAVCGHIKPNADMFRYICEKYELIPSETLFVDDSPKNIKGAEDFGIIGYLFDGDVAALEKFLEKNRIL